MTRKLFHPVIVIALFLGMRTGAETGAAETAPVVVPAPTHAEQARALVIVRETYKADYAKTDVTSRLALARKLLADGSAEKFDAAARFMLLQEAVDVAVSVGDATLAVKAGEVLGDRFTGLDSLASRVKFLQEAVASKAGAALAADAANTGIDLALIAVAADRFDLAEQAANAAESAGTKAGRVSQLTLIHDRLTEFRTILTEYKATLPARETLKTNANDAAASAKLGKFHGFYRNDWPMALSFLIKGDDATLKGLAEKEASANVDVVAMLQIADGWWDVAAADKGVPRANAAHHACWWYRKALPELAGGTKTRVEARLKATKPGVAETQQAKLDLFPMIDGSRDAVAGVWKLDGGTLTVEKEAYARIEIPLNPPEEYDLAVTFARAEGEGAITLLLPGPNGSAVGFTMDISNKARLEAINGKASTDNPTVTKFNITNDKKYTAVVQIRRDGIHATVDGKLLCEHKTNFKDVGRYKPWKLKDDTLLGLGANNCKVVFFKAELTAVTGEYKRVR